MSSPWNPDHWKQYNDVELLELREHLQRNAENDERGQDFRQWVEEINTILPGRQPNQQSNK